MPEAIGSNIQTGVSPQALTPQRQEPDENPTTQLRPEQRVEEPEQTVEQQARQPEPDERIGTQIDTQA